MRRQGPGGNTAHVHRSNRGNPVQVSLRQRLLISAVVDVDADFITIPEEQLGGNFDADITYTDLSEVTIDIDVKTVKLEDAIRDGTISVEEIFAYARLDARSGFCKETFESHNGLSKFIYRYHNFDLHLTYDVFETPDGQQHLISDLSVCRAGKKISTLYFDDETGMYLGREDWGITTEVTEVSPTGITFEITQAGGQQIGTLKTYTFLLDSETEQKSILQDVLEVDITMGGTTTVTWNWEESCGALPPGTYRLNFEVMDIFDKSQVHPLMQDFQNRQYYGFTFIIP